MSDVAAIAAVGSQMSHAQTRAEADVAILRRAMDTQADTARQLLDALPEVEGAASPAAAPDPSSMLGSRIDVRA